jgi:anti-anti-sigma factor
MAVDSGAALVIADMTATTFTTTMGIRTLVHAQKYAVAKSAELRLAISSQLVLRIFSAMGFDGYFAIYPSVAQAQAAGTTARDPKAR